MGLSDDSVDLLELRMNAAQCGAAPAVVHGGEREVEDAGGLDLRHLLLHHRLLDSELADQLRQEAVDGGIRAGERGRGAGLGPDEAQDCGGSPITEPGHGGELLGWGLLGHEKLGQVLGTGREKGPVEMGFVAIEMLEDEILQGPC